MIDTCGIRIKYACMMLTLILKVPSLTHHFPENALEALRKKCTDR